MSSNHRLNPREELVFLLRGFFSTPVLTSLGKMGFIDALITSEKPFSVEDISARLCLRNYRNLNYIFKYLSSIGLIKSCSADSTLFEVTDYGIKIMKRWGSAALLYSYRDAMNNLEELLTNEEAIFPSCDRLDNVIGSGLTNGRKFFPAAINILADNDPLLIADLCCGDGKFLSMCCDSLDNILPFASDLSEISVNSANQRFLSEQKPALNSIVSDVLDIDKWSQPVRSLAHHNSISEPNIVFCFWYLLHEISQHDPDKVVSLIKKFMLLFLKLKF